MYYPTRCVVLVPSDDDPTALRIAHDQDVDHAKLRVLWEPDNPRSGHPPRLSKRYPFLRIQEREMLKGIEFVGIKV